jgi:hypothetical protein
MNHVTAEFRVIFNDELCQLGFSKVLSYGPMLPIAQGKSNSFTELHVYCKIITR